MAKGESMYGSIERHSGMPEVPAAYAVALDGGSFSVSEAAHRAYDLVHVLPDSRIITGSGLTTSDAVRAAAVPLPPRLDVALLTPGEMGITEPRQTEFDFGFLHTNVNAYLHRRGVAIAVSINGSRSQIVDAIADGVVGNIKAFTGDDTVTEDELFRHVPGLSGDEDDVQAVPLREEIENESYATFVVASIASAVMNHGGRNMMHRHRAHERQRFLHSINALSVSALAAAGLAASAAYAIGSPEIAPLNLGITFTIYLALLRPYIGAYTKDEELRTNLFAQLTRQRVTENMTVLRQLYLPDLETPNAP